MKTYFLTLLLFFALAITGMAQSVDGAFKTLTASGTNTYTITEPTPSSLSDKERFLVRFTNANSGASTLNRAGLGAKAIKKADGTDVTTGDIQAGGTYLLSYNGTYYQIVGDGGGGGGAVSSVFGRTGAVTAQVGDYSAFFPILSGAYVNPSWITSLPWNKITATPTTLSGYSITGSLSEFNTALTGADFATGGGTATGSNNGDQTIAVTGTTTGITTLSASGGSMTIAGAGINTVGVSGSTITLTGTEVDGAVTNEGSLTVGAGTGTTSIINSNTSGSTGVTLTAGTGLGISEVGNVITLANTGVITEVDGSVSNELQTITNSSDATSHTVTLSNSGGTVQLIEGSNITLTTGGTGAAGTVTIASTGGGATNLDGLTDVVITSAATNKVLQYNGTNWVDQYMVFPVAVPTITANNYTLVATDHGKTLHINNGSTAVTVTIPTSLATNFQCAIVNKGTGIITLTPSGTTLESAGTTIETQHTGVTVYHHGSNVWTAVGSLGTPVTAYTDELAQDAVGGMVDASLTYVDGTPLLQRAALTGAVTASAGSNATSLGSFTVAQLSTAISDANIAGNNNGDQTFSSSSTSTSHTLSLSGAGGSLAIEEGPGINITTSTANGANNGITSIGLGSITTGDFNAVLSDNDIATGGGTATGTNTGDQTLSNSSDATSHTLTLSGSGGTVQFIEGSNITLTTAGTSGSATVTIASTGGGGSGDVVGPASSVNNTIARYNNTTGKIIKGSDYVLSDNASNFTLGLSTTTGSSRAIDVNGSAADVGLGITTKGAGSFQVNASTSATSNNSTLTSENIINTDAYSGAGFTNDIIRSAVSNSTTGTAATGIGSGIVFRSKTATANFESGAAIDAVSTDITAASEDFDLVFKNMTAGAAPSEKLRIKSDGKLVIATTPTADNAQTEILVRDAATGEIKTRGAASLGGGGGSGDVVGPASATNNAVALYDGTTGKLLKNSVITQDASGQVTTIYGSNPGIVNSEHFIMQNADYTLTSVGTEQKLFNSTTNGRLTIDEGTYFFEAVIYLTTMSATSGNGAFDILGAGSATVSKALYHVAGIDGVATSTATQTGSFSITPQSATNMVTAGTGTTMGVSIRGNFRISASGTIVPSITLTTANAAVVKDGTYFKCHRVGSSSVTSVGNWD